jgi:hypothetical protein
LHIYTPHLTWFLGFWCWFGNKLVEHLKRCKTCKIPCQYINVTHIYKYFSTFTHTHYTKIKVGKQKNQWHWSVLFSAGMRKILIFKNTKIHNYICILRLSSIALFSPPKCVCHPPTPLFPTAPLIAVTQSIQTLEELCIDSSCTPLAWKVEVQLSKAAQRTGRVAQVV